MNGNAEALFHSAIYSLHKSNVGWDAGCSFHVAGPARRRLGNCAEPLSGFFASHFLAI